MPKERAKVLFNISKLQILKLCWLRAQNIGPYHYSNKKNYSFSNKPFIDCKIAKKKFHIRDEDKVLRNVGKILATWTFNGHVFVRKAEEEHAEKITEEEQLAQCVEVIHERSNKTTNKPHKTKRR